MKKDKRRLPLRSENGLPAKAPAPPGGKRPSARASKAVIPAYDGPTKTDSAPKLRGGRGGANTKPAFEHAAIARPQAAAVTTDYGDQQPRRTRSPVESVEQYVRLRIRVHKDRLSVVDSHLVDGPLSQARGFPGSNAYEVAIGDRLIHAGPLPDLGVQRSFADPPGSNRQRGHYLTERTAYEFAARLPAHELTPKTISQISVRLYRLKEEAHSDRLSAAPLSKQFERQVRPVAELIGLPDSVLPAQIEKRGGRTPRV